MDLYELRRLGMRYLAYLGWVLEVALEQQATGLCLQEVSPGRWQWLQREESAPHRILDEGATVLHDYGDLPELSVELEGEL